MVSSISEAEPDAELDASAVHLGIVALIPSLGLESAPGTLGAPCTDKMGAIILNGGGVCPTVLKAFLVGVAIYLYISIPDNHVVQFGISNPFIHMDVATVLLRASARGVYCLGGRRHRFRESQSGSQCDTSANW